ncbi:ATP-binding protein [Streptomyces iconiensis]|uniref:histidine kinase n=1 Tax=Streptomyces iconiensis TaxID=1384038 RepID=A0ABT6ZMY0_9ACTN|nr:ATP-binding protein [Streptomyces iconiensis]MDJ1130413.1 ATP-binding protein [Streptomyces iconiensis]
MVTTLWALCEGDFSARVPLLTGPPGAPDPEGGTLARSAAPHAEGRSPYSGAATEALAAARTPAEAPAPAGTPGLAGTPGPAEAPVLAGAPGSAEAPVLAEAVNRLAARVEHLGSELLRVQREVARHGRIDERVRASPGQGAWADTVAAANSLIDTLTYPVVEATRVLTAVADGDLSQRIEQDDGRRPLRGELRRLGRTVNRVTGQLALFTSEVTRAGAEEDSGAGDDGRPAPPHTSLSNLSGSWRDAAEAVNQMVSDLRETTRAKEWLESNLTRLAALMQGRRDIREVAELIMHELPPLVGAQYGALFLTGVPAYAQGVSPVTPSYDTSGLSYVAGFGTAALDSPASLTPGSPAQGLVAQVAAQKRRLLLTDVPPGYVPIASGLGAAPPACVVILPVLYEDQVLGVLELASFSPFSDIHLAFFDQFMHTMGVALHTIRANTELSEKAALLTASSEYKTQFLANMSHELRTPLNSLLVLAQLLADNESGNLSDEEVRFAQTIHRSGTDLLQLINDVLDLSTVEAGRMAVRPQRLALLKLLTYVHDTFRPLASDRGIGFTVHVADATPRELFTDERRVQQVLRNLLSNAFKFTAEGRIELRVAPVAEDGRTAVDFTVSDTGTGIAPDRLSRIFEAFQQGDGSTHRTFGGTGLGLSISQEIASLLGGRIRVESTEGQGSHFTLTLPVGLGEGQGRAVESVAGGHTGAGARHQPLKDLTETPADRAAPPPSLAPWQRGRAAEVLPGVRVLIVDDDIRNVFALTHVLGRVGMSVRYAENGCEGLTKLAEEGADLVLMDIMMPELDGYETLRRLRRDPRLAGLPVVALTAQAMPGDDQQSLASGASAYVPKPVDIDLLLSTVLALLDPQPSARQ